MPPDHPTCCMLTYAQSEAKPQDKNPFRLVNQPISTTKLFVQIKYVVLDNFQKQKVQFTTVVCSESITKTNSKPMGGILQSSLEFHTTLSWFTVCKVEQG